MVDHEDTSKELRHNVILIRAEALVQCSANHSIAVECVTARVCGHVPLPRRRGGPALLCLKGMTLQWDFYSTG
jgi:translation elongation factor EF-4